MAVKSPCTDICIFSHAKGWCEGCGRTLKEAKEWRKLSPCHRKEIERALPLRIRIIGQEKNSD